MYEEYNTFMAAYERAEEKEIMHGLKDTVKDAYGKVKSFGKKQWDYTKAGAKAMKELGGEDMRKTNKAVRGARRNLRAVTREARREGLSENVTKASKEILDRERTFRKAYKDSILTDDAKKGFRNMGIAAGGVAATAGGAVAITKAVKKAKANKRAKKKNEQK